MYVHDRLEHKVEVEFSLVESAEGLGPGVSKQFAVKQHNPTKECNSLS